MAVKEEDDSASQKWNESRIKKDVLKAGVIKLLINLI